MSAPKRIQRKRTKGWRLPEGAVVVSRPGRWGNPYKITTQERKHYVWGPFNDQWPSMVCVPPAMLARCATINEARRVAVDAYRALLYEGCHPAVVHALDNWTHLCGHDLACWCPLEDADGNHIPCHADVLLEIANRSGS